MKNLKYIGQISKKESNYSIYNDSSGKEYKLFGGEIGDVVVKSLARDMVFAFDAKLWQMLEAGLEIITPNKEQESTISADALQEQIDKLKAIIQALKTSDNEQIIQEVEKLSKELEQKEKELASLKIIKDELADKRQELENSTARLNELNQEIARLNDELKAITNES